MPAVVDIKMLGDKRLSRALEKLPAIAQKRVVRKALRKSAKRQVGYVVALAPEDTGALKRGYRIAKVRALRHWRHIMGAGLDNPYRDTLGISPDDKWYYPFALEYGTKQRKGRGRIAAMRFIRDAVDRHAETEYRLLSQEIGHGIQAEWSRLAK